MLPARGRLQWPVEQPISVTRIDRAAQVTLPRTGVPQPSGQQLRRQMEKAELPIPSIYLHDKMLPAKCGRASTAVSRGTGLLAPLPQIPCLGHHFEPTANTTQSIILKMLVAREEKEREEKKKVWTLATAPGVLCGGSLGSCDTFWAPEKAW